MNRESFSQELLENIIPYWVKMLGDGENFCGRIDGHGVPHPEAEKSAVMTFRMLWSFSAAYRSTGSAESFEAACKVYEWALKYFIDRRNGGVYWSVNADGSVLDSKKQSYAIGFAIYALSEFAMACAEIASGKEETARDAAALAYTLFHNLEDHAWDAEHFGYVEALTADWKPIEDMRLSDKDMNSVFSMNTHLHLLEPYTNLYRVSPSAELYEAIVRLTRIFTERIWDPSVQHLGLFFNEKWERQDSIISYGHDIEASWLIDEALIVSGMKDVEEDAAVYEAACKVVRQVAAATVCAVAEDGHLCNEKDFSTGHTDTTAIWWVQAEAVTGYHNIFELTGDESYRTLSARAWEYIQNNIVDKVDGEWFWSILPDGTPQREEDKAGFWKCPYHNSRMCIEMLRRLS